MKKSSSDVKMLEHCIDAGLPRLTSVHALVPLPPLYTSRFSSQNEARKVSTVVESTRKAAILHENRVCSHVMHTQIFDET